MRSELFRINDEVSQYVGISTARDLILQNVSFYKITNLLCGAWRHHENSYVVPFQQNENYS